jgi:ribulose-phosphate 3-epimerase
LSKHHIPYGLAIHPYSDPDRYQAILKTCDYVLVMGVIPGKGGQAFIPQTIANLIKVKKIKTDFNPKLIIQLDGGVNDQIMQQTANYVDHFIIGTFLMHNPQNMPNVFNLAKQLS